LQTALCRKEIHVNEETGTFFVIHETGTFFVIHAHAATAAESRAQQAELSICDDQVQSASSIATESRAQ